MKEKKPKLVEKIRKQARMRRENRAETAEKERVEAEAKRAQKIENAKWYAQEAFATYDLAELAILLEFHAEHFHTLGVGPDKHEGWVFRVEHDELPLLFVRVLAGAVSVSWEDVGESFVMVGPDIHEWITDRIGE